MSHLLRHEPWTCGLELDELGWVSVDDLLEALAFADGRWRGLTEQDLAQAIETQTKTRFELQAGHIRALYGHSTPARIKRPAQEPPHTLYHGTSPLKIDEIRRQGLRPMRRQYVHLSTTELAAHEVGRRKHRQPVVLTILAGHAWRQGVPFYKANDMVWLADYIGPEFME